MVIHVHVCYAACLWSIRGYTSNYVLQSQTDKRKTQLAKPLQRNSGSNLDVTYHLKFNYESNIMSLHQKKSSSRRLSKDSRSK